jgi:hypothetical protein
MRAPRLPLLLGILVATLLFAALVGLGRGRLPGVSPRALDPEAAARRYGLALPELPGSAGWIQGPAPTRESLAGHPVILAQFSGTDPREREWLTGIEEWHEAYAPLGVRVAGLLRPQFAFAADTAYARRIARRLALRFPIALDTAGAVTARWPGQVLMADTAGRVLLSANAPDAIERGTLDALFRERMFGDARPAVFGATPRRMPNVLRVLRLGAGQFGRGPLATAAAGVTATFVTQTRFEEEGQKGVPVPVGRWTPQADALVAARGGAANFLAIRYDAERVSVVASPPTGLRARLWLLRDEQWVPAAARGDDVRADASGATYVELDGPGLFVLAGGKGSHVLKLSPDQAGVTLHALMFDDPSAGTPRR